MPNDSQSNISEDLDRLSCELMGEILDLMAGGAAISVVASVMDAEGMRVTCAFEKDAPDVCLDAAHEWVRGAGRGKTSATAGKGGDTSAIGLPICYAIAYEGAVAAEGDSFQDALLLEFGERGAKTGYSAYALVANKGKGDDFAWSDPQPAGEVDLLL